MLQQGETGYSSRGPAFMNCDGDVRWCCEKSMRKWFPVQRCRSSRYWTSIEAHSVSFRAVSVKLWGTFMEKWATESLEDSERVLKTTIWRVKTASWVSDRLNLKTQTWRLLGAPPSSAAPTCKQLLMVTAAQTLKRAITTSRNPRGRAASKQQEVLL